MKITEQSCSERIEEMSASRIRDIVQLANCPEQTNEDGESLNEYGLHLHAQEAENGETYLCWLLSTGGPHEEIRFYFGASKECYRVEFVLMDWYDISTLEIKEGLDTLHAIFDEWAECGACENIQEDMKRI